jgi:hypothetical protein
VARIAQVRSRLPPPLVIDFVAVRVTGAAASGMSLAMMKSPRALADERALMQG